MKMTRRQICDYYLARTILGNKNGCLKVLPEVNNNYNHGYLQASYKGKTYLLGRLIALEKIW